MADSSSARFLCQWTWVRSDVERLRELVGQRALVPGESLEDVVGTELGVACVARTTVTEPNAALAEFFRDQLMAEVPFEERAAIERSLSETNVRRDWYVARDTQMANVWYRGPNGETVAADLVECESMVRSIRFESARPEVE